MIWLRYKNLSSVESMRFNDLGVVTRSLTRRAEGTTLREIDFANTLSVRRTYDISIGPDETCKSGRMDFLVGFWEAHAWWISLDGSVTVPDDASFIQCNIPSGDDPRQLFEDHASFASFNFMMTEKHPR